MLLRYKIFIILLILCMSSCSIYDEMDYTYIKKASIFLCYEYNENTLSSIEDVDNITIFIFDGNNKFFREEQLTIEQLKQDSIEITYLPNDNYTLVSWANIGEYTTTLIDETSSFDDALLYSIGANNTVKSCDPLKYNKSTFSIKKGDQLYSNVTLSSKTYKVKLTIYGTEYLEDIENYKFTFSYYSSLNFNGGNTGEMLTYSPTLINNDDDILSAEFNVLNFTANEEIQFSLANDNILDFPIAFTAQLNDIITNINDNILDMKIHLIKGEVTVIINDWVIITEQITNLGK